MIALDLFSGIGGFSLGLRRAGIETAAFCELDEYCQKILKKNFPGIPIAGDIRKLSYKNGVLFYDGQEIYRGPIDLVCGGFPCQPFSHAGDRRGTADDRNLWPEMLRIIKAVRPRWLFCENVNGITSFCEPYSEFKMDSQQKSRLDKIDSYNSVLSRLEKLYLSRILQEIEGAGYNLPAGVDGTHGVFNIPAIGVDAPHHRQRIWIVAHTNAVGQQQPGGDITKGGGRFSGGGTQGLADGIREGLERYSGNVPAGRKPGRHGKEKGGPISKGGILHPGRSRGPSTGGKWDPEPGMGRVANGVPYRVDRIRALGNAVVPQVIQVIAETIIETERTWIE